MTREGHDGSPAGPAAADGRSASARTALLPLAVIVAALLAILVVPIMNTQRTEEARRRLREATEPARHEVTAVHLALAMGESWLRSFLETGDTAELTAYRQAVADLRTAARTLDSLAPALAPEHGTVFEIDALADTLQAQMERWHLASEALLGTAGTAGGAPAAPAAPARDSLHLATYTATLLTAARLDAAITRVADRYRLSIERTDSRARRLTSLLGAVALVGVAAAAWLGWRLQEYVLAEERRRRELLQVVETRARFMRGLSHDLKNPLGAIDGHAQLLEMGLVGGELSAEQRDSVGRIRGAVRSLLTIIDDLLELAAAESGGLRIKPEDTDLAALVHELAAEHHAAATAAGLALTVDADGPLPARTDPARVRQIVGNLLSNAVKYTPAGGRVEVRLRRAPAAADRLLVEVADTGPGIPPDRREHIFGEFTRLHTASTSGAGLGLAVSRRIAHMLGGNVYVAPPGPPGAVFVLELPARGRSG